MNQISSPPSMDAVAAQRWQQHWLPHSPWLHDEVARRMEERLQWITLQPQQWLHWQPSKGSVAAHALLRQRYPQATAWAYEPHASAAQQAGLLRQLDGGSEAGWLQRTWARMRSGPTRSGKPAPGSINMLWANMALHTHASPQALLAQWRELLAVNGFVMFSALGPDSLRELRELYQRLGWAPPSHAFTDMHDWGDMLVQAGFAEPVMDMERITLTFSSPERLLQELRGLGRNLAADRDARSRGPGWLRQLHQGLDTLQRGGSLPLTFEIIYGHALQPPPRHKVEGTTAISLQHMQDMLRQGKS